MHDYSITIDNKKYVSIYEAFYISDLKESLKNYFLLEDDINSKIERYFNGEKKIDFILENLQTHDWKLLKKSIEKESNNLIEVNKFYKSDSGENKEFLRLFLDEDKFDLLLDFLKNGKGKDIINFYGYTFSGVLDNCVYLEPEFPKLGNDFIYNECHGVCYHLCNKEDTPKILKRGLRCKNKKDNEARNYPKRIYVYASEPKPKKEIKKELNNVANAISFFKLNLSDFDVLKINVSKHVSAYNINFYTDTVMNDGHSFFIYQNIPPSMIELVNF